jgi:hypothetical protein
VLAAGLLPLHPGNEATAINSKKAQVEVLFIVHLPSIHHTQTALSRNPYEWDLSALNSYSEGWGEVSGLSRARKGDSIKVQVGYVTRVSITPPTPAPPLGSSSMPAASRFRSSSVLYVESSCGALQQFRTKFKSSSRPLRNSRECVTRARRSTPTLGSSWRSPCGENRFKQPASRCALMLRHRKSKRCCRSMPDWKLRSTDLKPRTRDFSSNLFAGLTTRITAVSARRS